MNAPHGSVIQSAHVFLNASISIVICRDLGFLVHLAPEKCVEEARIGTYRAWDSQKVTLKLEYKIGNYFETIYTRLVIEKEYHLHQKFSKSICAATINGPELTGHQISSSTTS